MASYLVFVHRTSILNVGKQIREMVDVCGRRLYSRAWAHNTGRVRTDSNIWNLVAVNQFISSEKEYEQAQSRLFNADSFTWICGPGGTLSESKREGLADKAEKTYRL